jgi:hypothetical protein
MTSEKMPGIVEDFNRQGMLLPNMDGIASLPVMSLT